MIVTPVRTHKITSKDKNLFEILDKYIKSLKENSVVAVTSKIVSITEGRIIKIKSQITNNKSQKDELIEKEAELYLPRSSNKYNVSLTIARGHLAASGGIDESNADGYYVLWPKNSQETADKIREHLSKRYKLKHLGVIITDSRTTPLRWGVTGVAIAHSGFYALKDYMGTKDLFGREFEFEKTNIADSLATSATVVMGEGSEQTPIAIIEDVPFVRFHDRNPTKKELDELKIDIEDDLYAPLLKSVSWKKGRSGDKS
jgi:putative folate metabolism gamma-glutamate ligase